MKVAVIIPAAGVGRRFSGGSFGAGSGGASKIELDMAGRPVFLRAIEAFLGRADVAQVILAVNPDVVEAFRFRHGDRLMLRGVEVVPGGRRERWETVLHAIQAVREDCTHIAVHDAARPLPSAALIERVFSAAAAHGAVVPGLPVSNTLKRVGEAVKPAASGSLDAILGAVPGEAGEGARRVVETVPRADLVEVQTPQTFEAGLLRRAYSAVRDGRIDPAGITDDASLVEALGEPVVVVDGEATNFKITRPADADLVAAVLERREQRQAAATAKKRLFAEEDDD